MLLCFCSVSISCAGGRVLAALGPSLQPWRSLPAAPLWQDYKVHIKHLDGSFEYVPYFCLPGEGGQMGAGVVVAHRAAAGCSGGATASSGRTGEQPAAAARRPHPTHHTPPCFLFPCCSQ